MTDSDSPQPNAAELNDSGPIDSTSGDASVVDMSYGDALAELEELLTELEDADIDVDLLTERVARGAQLVRHCQERLAIVSGEVDNVVSDLATPGPAPDTDLAESAGEG